MEYRKLGNTGLKVSALSLGSWITFSDQLDDKEVLNHMALAFDNGINLFDNAEAYGFGKAETKMGTAIKKLKWTRDSFIITSKVLFGGDKPTQKGLNKKHINDACTNSLIRLNLEYLDIFYCHRHDPDTPLLETIYAMNDLIIQGKILYWGTSEWSLWLKKTIRHLAYPVFGVLQMVQLALLLIIILFSLISYHEHTI